MALSLPAPTAVAGDGVLLRPWTSSDLPAIQAIAADDLIVRWNPFPADIGDWLERRSVWDDHVSWAVAGPDGELVGSVSLFQFEPASDHCQLGYWTSPSNRGRGVAARAVRCATEFAFTTLGLERIAVFHAVENSASCRVALKSGFALEGTTRKSWRYADGALHDEHVHARLRTDQ